jgi:hypothetical protein
MKCLKVVTIGCNRPPSTIYLQPGTKTINVLASLRLDYSPDCYVLAPDSDLSTDLYDEKDLYSKVQDQQTLIVMTLTEAADRSIPSFCKEKEEV